LCADLVRCRVRTVMNENGVRWWGFLACIICLTLLVGCASTASRKSVAPPPEFTANPRTMSVQLWISDNQYTTTGKGVDTLGAHASAMNSAPGGNPAAVLLGHLIAEAIIQGTASDKVARIPDPMLAFTKPFPVSDRYGQDFRQSIESSNWIRVTSLSLSRTEGEVLNIAATQQRSAQDALLVAHTQYSFSTTYRQLFVETNVDLWEAGAQEEPVYRASFVFSSPVIRGRDLEETLELWSQNDAWRFRAALAWGLDANLRMARTAITQAKNGTAGRDHGPERVTIVDRKGVPTDVEALVVETDPVWRMLNADGNYHFVARQDLPLAELDVYLRRFMNSPFVVVQARK